MVSRLLWLVPALMLAVSVPALAQEKALPQSREELQLSFSPLVKKIAPAVVNIYTKRTVAVANSPFAAHPFFSPFFQQNTPGGRRSQVENSLGSGVIVEPDGLVVTNTHVVKDADEITAVLADGREFPARLVLKDPPSDLALLRLDVKDEELPYATLKPSESLEVGDLVLAVGNPFGVGQTVTSGIVSALARSSLNISDFNFFIQTDAAINPGNSGGPLVALDGGVVGINTAIYSRDGGSLGIGFAVPSEMVATVIAAEKAGQSGDKPISRPWLGLTVQNMTQDIASSLGLARPAGALVTVLHDASPLLKAGLKVGDVVSAINGREIRDASEMKFRMATVPIGQTAKLDVIRKGQKMHFDVPAILPPDEPPRKETTLAGQHPLGGAVVANLNPAVAVELGMFGEAESGVVVLRANRQSARFFSPGQVILKINGRDIKTVQDVEPALALSRGQGWNIVVSSRGHIQQLLLR